MMAKSSVVIIRGKLMGQTKLQRATFRPQQAIEDSARIRSGLTALQRRVQALKNQKKTKSIDPDNSRHILRH